MPKVPAKIIPASQILIVGDAPGALEELRLELFVGQPGELLAEMLHSVGIIKTGCSLSTVCKLRPPGNDIDAFIAMKIKERTSDHKEILGRFCLPPIHEGIKELWAEINALKPKVIVALGNTALWALTGNQGIGSWRGSYLKLLPQIGHQCLVIPTYSPTAILRNWEWRSVAIQDLRRVAAAVKELPVRPKWNFKIFPTCIEVLLYLKDLKLRLDLGPIKLACDIETIRRHTACIGIATSKVDAFCIPLFTKRNFYTLEQELDIIIALRSVLAHPNARVVGQNFLYDTQYFLREFFFIPSFARDTMFQQHVAFPGTPKSLDYLSSMYCDYHVYWKDDLKDYKNAPADDAKFFNYNCEDCCRTWEADASLQDVITSYGLHAPMNFQHEMFWNCLDAMIRGVKIDKTRRAEFSKTLRAEMAEREARFISYLGHSLNPRSPKQMHTLFYYDFGFKPVLNRSTHKATLDDKALSTIAKREPLMWPLIEAIQEYRSLGVFASTFVEAPLDIDDRMRTAYNPASVETFRLSSSENAFGSGTNLQNVPKGDDPDEREPGQLVLPNVRTIFVPDPGFTFFDMDLDRADLQVVVWEADDADLKLALRMNVDLHCYSACDVFDIKGIPVDELINTHPNYKEHRGRIGESRRQKTKAGVHAVDYFCQARTLAIALGVTTLEAQRFIDKWLGAHPGIKAWHNRTIASLTATRSVSNKFGYRRLYFDRPETVLPEALAWVPQSTVACVINRAWNTIRKTLSPKQIAYVLLQVHDSLAGQFPTARKAEAISLLLEATRIVIPYDDPLIIPASIKTSEISWGDCE